MCKDCGCEESPTPVFFTHDARFAREHVVRIEQDLLADNDRCARENRRRLDVNHSLGVNVVSSPGAGKTTLLERTVSELRCPVAVIEGDQRTSRDAERIRARGAPTLQINTGAGCHLDARMVRSAFDGLVPFPSGGLLFIENVGNLICPTEFDLGEHERVVLLSCTEGEDKPLKYPGIFASSSLLVLTKVDLLPHLQFDVDECLGFALSINPQLEVLQVSTYSGDGLASWYTWLESRRLRVMQSTLATGPTGAT